VSLNLYESEIFVLLGENGAGKSTLIDIIIGRLKKDGGTLTFIDNQLKLKIDNLTNFVGICPQKDILFPFLTVRNTL